MQKPAIGRIVHYKFPEGEFERPAMIVRTWGSEPESAVQLQVFIDANEQGQHNDGYNLSEMSNVVWRTSVLQGTEPGQFHFHEDCQETP